MAASPSIVKALEGHHATLVGSGEHEEASALLGRAIAELRGAGPPPSPGQRAVHDAAMNAEKGHPGGDGQKRSNEPAPPARHSERPPDIHGSSEHSDHMSGTSPVPSRGQAISAMPGGYAGGTSQVRRIAAAREMSRRDSKFKPLTRAEENNKQNMPRGEGYPTAARVGNATSSPKVTGGDHDADDIARGGRQEPSENTPPRLGGQQRNPFARAGEQARERFRSRR